MPAPQHRFREAQQYGIVAAQDLTHRWLQAAHRAGSAAFQSLPGALSRKTGLTVPCGSRLYRERHLPAEE